MVKLAELLFENYDDGDDDDAMPETLVSINLITDEVKQQLITVAQTVYDQWHQDENGVDEHYGYGGICDDIANAMLHVLFALSHDMNVVSTYCSMDSHTSLVGKFTEGVFSIDIPARVYETGAAYTWKQKRNIQFDVNHVVIYQLSRDPETFDQYTEGD